MEVRIDDRGKFFTPRVSKESVFSLVRTTEHVIVGHVYVRPEHRLKDELNSEAGRFLAVTDARVFDDEGQKLLYESSFLLIAYHHVILISPIEAISGDERPGWAVEEHKEEA